MFSTENNVDPKSTYFFNTPSTGARELFFYPTILGNYTYSSAYSLKRSSFDSFLVMFIVSGNMSIKTEYFEGDALPGNVVFLDCYRMHEYSANARSQVMWIHFDGSLARAYYDRFLSAKNGNISVPVNPVKIQRCFEDIIGTYEKSLSVDEAVVSLKISALLTELLIKETKAESNKESILRAAASYITDNFAYDISLEELASKIGLSPYYFSREFKKEIGVPPHQYLLETRISYAEYLLSSTEKPVSEIAYLSGFKDTHLFTPCFRKRTGMTPSAYRDVKRAIN